MWPTLQDNLIAGIAALTAAVGLVGAWVKFRISPRRAAYWVAGFFSVAKERELSLASAAAWKERAENEMAWKDYWKQQAQECIEQFQAEFQRDTREEYERVLRAGGGRISSGGGDGPTPTERLTG